MLTRLVNLSRSSRMQIIPSASYNFFAKPFEGLDPARHIYMNHAPENQYDDLFQLGDYPYVEQFAQAQDPQSYVPDIVNVLVSHLAEKNPQLKLSLESYQRTNDSTALWEELGVVNFNAEVPAILTKLAEKLIVKESKLTWTKEQRFRLDITQKGFGPLNFNNTSVVDFVRTYNATLWVLVRRSHFWRAPNIVGDKSPLEKQIERESSPQPKIASLHSDRPENKNIFNSFLRLVHA